MDIKIFVLLTLLVLFGISAFCDYFTKEAQKHGMQAAEALYRTMGRLCLGLSCVIYLALLIRIGG